MAIKNQVQLITYPDSLGGDLRRLNELLLERFTDIFPGGVHILPPFPSSGDRGFAPLTYLEINPDFGSWQDIRAIGECFDVALDLMVNHLSRQSPYFQDFLKQGFESPYADLFITLDKIWPEGDPPPEDVVRIFLRRPGHPFSTVSIGEAGETTRIWTTFGKSEQPEQIDLDLRSAATRELLSEYLAFFARQGVKIVRLDAIGYVVKKAGSPCFMVEPEIYEVMAWLDGVAQGLGLELLPEVHSEPPVQARLAERGYWVYDFVLPLLVLDTLLHGSSSKLREHLASCPRRQFTMLDCHDGIPVQPDLEGILTKAEMRRVVDVCVQRGANLSRILAPGSGDCDAHQINCTYYSALGCDDDAYLAARAIQFFAPGVPQVYYVGLLAGQNDQQAVRATGEGRAVNRHNYSLDAVEALLDTPVVRRLLQLIRFRNEHPAFNGEFEVLDAGDDQVVMTWQQGAESCRLNVELGSYRALILYTDGLGRVQQYQV